MVKHIRILIMHYRIMIEHIFRCLKFQNCSIHAITTCLHVYYMLCIVCMYAQHFKLTHTESSLLSSNFLDNDVFSVLSCLMEYLASTSSSSAYGDHGLQVIIVAYIIHAMATD